MASVVTINGRTIILPDGAGGISIINNTLYVGGVEWKDEAGSPADLGTVLRVELTGDLLALTCDRSVAVTGGVAGNVKAGGSVSVGHAVGGNVTADGSASVGGSVGAGVKAGGSVACGDVTGDADAGGSVKCGRVAGTVRAGGSVRHG